MKNHATITTAITPPMFVDRYVRSPVIRRLMHARHGPVGPCHGSHQKTTSRGVIAPALVLSSKRAKGLEPSTYTLATCRSTTELRPRDAKPVRRGGRGPNDTRWRG